VRKLIQDAVEYEEELEKIRPDRFKEGIEDLPGIEYE